MLLLTPAPTLAPRGTQSSWTSALVLALVLWWPGTLHLLILGNFWTAQKFPREACSFLKDPRELRGPGLQVTYSQCSDLGGLQMGRLLMYNPPQPLAQC